MLRGEFEVFRVGQGTIVPEQICGESSEVNAHEADVRARGKRMLGN
jgi:hypothetical protein